MMIFRLVVSILLCVGAPVAFGQFEIELKLDSDNYLKYEPITAHVKVSNFTGHTIGLFNHHDKSWLSFYVARQNGEQANELGVEYDLQQVQVPGNDSKTFHVNLTPVYNIRAPGIYRVMATVYCASYDRQFKSNMKSFELRTGREIWKETVAVLPTNVPPETAVASIDTNAAPLPPLQEDLHTYVLLANRVDRNDRLYARVENEAKNLVYGVIPLGILVGFGQPETMVDKRSNLHVLHQVGSRAYAYAAISPNAKTIDQRMFSNMKSRPRLKADDTGTVSVIGGEQTYPDPSAPTIEPFAETTSTDTPTAKE